MSFIGDLEETLEPFSNFIKSIRETFPQVYNCDTLRRETILITTQNFK